MFRQLQLLRQALLYRAFFCNASRILCRHAKAVLVDILQIWAVFLSEYFSIIQ